MSIRDEALNFSEHCWSHSMLEFRHPCPTRSPTERTRGRHPLATGTLVTESGVWMEAAYPNRSEEGACPSVSRVQGLDMSPSPPSVAEQHRKPRNMLQSRACLAAGLIGKLSTRAGRIWRAPEPHQPRRAPPTAATTARMKQCQPVVASGKHVRLSWHDLPT